MSGLSNYTYTTLKQAILDYTEVDSNVFTTTILDGFIMAAQNRINLDLPMDSDRLQAEAQFATDFNSITMPTKLLFVRGIEVYDSTTSTTGPSTWLEKRDQTFISEYVGELTGPEGGAAAQDTTGLPKYYSMFGGGGIYALDANLENGTLIAIYEKMMDGNPISKSYGTWGEKGLQFYGEPEPVEPEVIDSVTILNSVDDVLSLNLSDLSLKECAFANIG